MVFLNLSEREVVRDLTFYDSRLIGLIARGIKQKRLHFDHTHSYATYRDIGMTERFKERHPEAVIEGMTVKAKDFCMYY